MLLAQTMKYLANKTAHISRLVYQFTDAQQVHSTGRPTHSVKSTRNTNLGVTESSFHAIPQINSTEYDERILQSELMGNSTINYKTTTTHHRRVVKQARI